MRKIKKGVTLLEVVISLAIISIMMIPLANGLLTSVRFNKSAESSQTAKLLSQQLVEKLKIQNKIEQNSIIEFHDTNIELLRKINVGSKSIPIKSSNDINGFDLSGEIIEENVKLINKAYEDMAIKKNIEVFIYLDVDSTGNIKGYINRPSGINTKLENCFLDESSIGNKKIPSIPSDKVSIDMVVSADKKISIKVNQTDFINTDVITTLGDGALAIYINDARVIQDASGAQIPSIEITFDNQLTERELHVFRNYKLDKNVLDKALLIETTNLKGPIKLTKNIIYDEHNGSEGLYTTKIDILKEGKVIEKTESQFYLGK